jgi:nucleoside-diphosphate-sugar epimerase
MKSIFITGALGALGSNLILRSLQHDPPFKIIATDIVPEVNHYLLEDITKLGIKREDCLEYYFLDVTQS